MDPATAVLIRLCNVFIGLLLMVFSGALLAEEAEDFYTANVESFVQSKCILCHRAGGTVCNLIFSNSASSNHQEFDDYVNSPTKGARANRVLSKITGGLGHERRSDNAGI